MTEKQFREAIRINYHNTDKSINEWLANKKLPYDWSELYFQWEAENDRNKIKYASGLAYDCPFGTNSSCDDLYGINDNN